MDAQLTFFSPIDGVRLYYEWWMPPSPKAILVVVHGVGEHSGRYGPLLRYFGERGFGLAIYDQRGHGHSSGRRGHVEHFQDLLGDLAHFVQMLRERYPAVPLFLVGHSLGGQVVLNFVVRYAKGLRGIVCSSPSVQLAVPVRSWKQRLIQTMYRWVPTARVGQQIRAEDLSHDPEVVRRYREDPLIVRRMTAQMAVEILRNMELVMAMASRIHLPTFFQVAGADCLCDQEGARRFFRRIPVARKQLKIYDGFSHEIYNEVERETVFADMERWITEMLQDERIVAHPVEARRPLAVGPSAVAAGTVEIGSL